MAARLICSKTVLARSGTSKGWVLGTLYVHEDDLRFDPRFGGEPAGLATHLTWPQVSAIGWRRGSAFRSIEIVHDGGVEHYLCIGADRFARRLDAAWSDCRPQPSMRQAA